MASAVVVKMRCGDCVDDHDALGARDHLCWVLGLW